MELTHETTRNIEQIADDALTQFEKVAEAAQKALRSTMPNGADAFASVNTMTSSAVQNLGQISQTNRESYQTLVKEPAIARVVVNDEHGNRSTYYICRATPVSGISNFASYRAPVGRLASLQIGAEFTFPNGTLVEVLERAQLRPSFSGELWDSRDTIIEGDDFGPVTIESLRALIAGASSTELAEDLLEQLLAEESQTANIIEGIRRRVITKMGLRDQPILDQYQDEIFRLPLDQRLLILGPPGTGKTTTLIRRLGQKLDTVFLDEDERRIVENLSGSNRLEHVDSWLMFTPTELLKQYLKEAFAREGVPASDYRIRTWSDYRRELARNTFGVLRTAANNSGFVLKDSIYALNIEAVDDPIAWFTDFNSWQRSDFVADIRQSAQGLIENQLPEIAAIGQRLNLIIQQADDSSLASMFTTLVAEVAGIQSLLAGMKEVTDKKIKEALNIQLNRDKNFIEKLVKFIDGLQQTPEVETDELDDQESDEEDVNQHKTGRAAAATAYIQAIRAHARAHFSKRNIGKTSRNGKIIEWLGDRGLKDTDRAQVGASLIVQASARRFVNPVKRYMDGIPRRYRNFRRMRQEENKWYQKESFNPTDLHPLELDILLLAILRSANDLLSKQNIARDIDLLVWSSLKPVLDLYKNQILVDEVTDFSPVQIACMAALSQPRISSFFACGDFNQRLTTWGSRSIDQIKWVFPGIDIKEITVSYRQSRQLNDLARAIILAAGGSDQGVTLPAHVDNEGFPPSLLEGESDRALIVDWLAQRIREIERLVRQLPSIAIFVDSESDVQPVADALNAALADENTQVVACSNGQVMGQDNDVRVFDVQHIKGLEFEAVFFIGIDRLATLHPQLFDKYLYVGTTRAATYLGVTCDHELPAAIASLRPMFVPDWNSV